MEKEKRNKGDILMNLLLIASWYPNTESLINGVFIKNQAIALSKVGINVVVLYPYDKSVKIGDVALSIEDNIKTYRANTDYIKNTKLSRFNSINKSIKLIDKIVKEYNIELIHAHVCYSAGFAAAFYKKICSLHLPLVITEHMSYISKYNSKFYNRWLFKYAYHKADLVIPVSKALEKEMRGMNFKFSSIVVGNVVNNDIWVRQNTKVHKNEYNAVFVGLMSRNRVKGIEYLLLGFSKFIRNNGKYNSNVKLKLHLAGDGELLEEYRKMTKDLGIEGMVVFHGRLNRKELGDLMNTCDFLIVSSIKETFGSVLIEAMSVGIPVISTKCGGPEDFVNDKVGILVEPKSADAIEAGIRKMINNFDSFDSEYIKTYAIDNFGSEAIGNKLKKMYNDLLEK